MTIYNKLVRDRIPEILEAKGKKYTVRQVGVGFEKGNYLKKKLVEETDEFLKDPSLEELADVQEVVFAIVENLGFTREDLEVVREAKMVQRGGFDDNWVLEEVL
jgi:predicted house-cleaning noncanonical NTP pyrophosphatase (MazG superfamily)